MLSFRYDLSAAQVRTLLDVYAGNWQPPRKSKRSIDQQIQDHESLGLLQGSARSHFVPIASRLIDKGLILHVGNNHSEYGYICTEKGKFIARLIIEDAAKIIEASRWATKRGVA